MPKICINYDILHKIRAVAVIVTVNKTKKPLSYDAIGKSKMTSNGLLLPLIK